MTNPRCHPERAAAPLAHAAKQTHQCGQIRLAFCGQEQPRLKAFFSNSAFTTCCSAAPADPRLRRQEVVRELSESRPAAPAWATALSNPMRCQGEAQVSENGILNLQLWGTCLQNIKNISRDIAWFRGCCFFHWYTVAVGVFSSIQ